MFLLLWGLGCQSGREFSCFLFDFMKDLSGRGPIKANPGRFLSQPLRLNERRRTLVKEQLCTDLRIFLSANLT